MTKMTYMEMMGKTFELYMKGEYKKAFEFITEHKDRVKGIDAQIFNFRYAIASKAGLINEALDIFEEAIIDKGFWYSYEYLIADDDLEPLRDNPRFQELVDICRKREIEEKENPKPVLKLIKPDNEQKKHPLLIALHGNQENAYVTEDRWKSSLDKNYILALAQSSQVSFSQGYVWNDVILGAKELQEHLDHIISTNHIDENNIMIGGFSAGGRLTLYSILNNIVNAKGCILVGPWLPEINEWETAFDNLKDKNTTFYIFVGDQDEVSLEGSKELVEKLKARNIPYTFNIIEGLAHRYPENFSEELLKIVE